MQTTIKFDSVSASAVSAMIRRAGFKRASKKGYSTGFDVVGCGTVVYVYYQETDDAKRQQGIEAIIALFNERPGYAATFEVASHMAGIDDSPVIHVRRPVDVVEVEEVVEAEPVEVHPLVSAPRFRQAEQALSALRRTLDAAPENFFTQLYLDAERTERNLAKDADEPEDWTLQVMYLVPGKPSFTRVDITFFGGHQNFCSGITYQEFHGIQAIMDHIRFALVEH